MANPQKTRHRHVLVDALPEQGPVPDGVDGVANVDVVKLFLRVRPAALVLNVVDDEAGVLWDPVRLDRREIHAVKL